MAGRPKKDPSERTINKSVRLTEKQWKEFEANGGVAWLRQLLNAVKL